MSKVPYSPESQQMLQDWMDSCPRECASMVVVFTYTSKPNGMVSCKGIVSITNTSRADALEMFENAIDDLDGRREQLIARSIEFQE